MCYRPEPWFVCVWNILPNSILRLREAYHSKCIFSTQIPLLFLTVYYYRSIDWLDSTLWISIWPCPISKLFSHDMLHCKSIKTKDMYWFRGSTGFYSAFNVVLKNTSWRRITHFEYSSSLVVSVKVCLSQLSPVPPYDS